MLHPIIAGLAALGLGVSIDGQECPGSLTKAQLAMVPKGASVYYNNRKNTAFYFKCDNFDELIYRPTKDKYDIRGRFYCSGGKWRRHPKIDSVCKKVECPDGISISKNKWQILESRPDGSQGYLLAAFGITRRPVRGTNSGWTVSLKFDRPMDTGTVRSLNGANINFNKAGDWMSVTSRDHNEDLDNLPSGSFANNYYFKVILEFDGVDTKARLKEARIHPKALASTACISDGGKLEYIKDIPYGGPTPEPVYTTPVVYAIPEEPCENGTMYYTPPPPPDYEASGILSVVNDAKFTLADKVTPTKESNLDYSKGEGYKLGDIKVNIDFDAFHHQLPSELDSDFPGVGLLTSKGPITSQENQHFKDMFIDSSQCQADNVSETGNGQVIHSVNARERRDKGTYGEQPQCVPKTTPQMEFAKLINTAYYNNVANDAKNYDGTTAQDLRPNGAMKYIDHSTGEKTTTRPSSGHYGVLPTAIIRDPTCQELQNVVAQYCNFCEGSWPDYGSDGFSMGLLCGRGTTWEASLQQCVTVGDDYSTIPGNGQPFSSPVYPTIRPEGVTTAFDDPDAVYVYLNALEQAAFDACPLNPYANANTGNGKGGKKRRQIGFHAQRFPCAADRCRYPLTSTEGQTQAVRFVSLFRTVYEYSGTNSVKVTRRTRLRQLIDNHEIWFSLGIHGNGAFLPWHRWFLLEVETILMQEQSEQPGFGDYVGQGPHMFVGIPYWDWHNLGANQSPRAFINDNSDSQGYDFHSSLGQDSAPTFGCINQGALGGFLLTNGACLQRGWAWSDAEETPETDLHPLYPLATQFNQFRNRLESGAGLHGSVHGIVGGAMATTKSANDPIFYTHHGNVDKIWSDWQTQSTAHMNAYSGSTPIGSLMPASTGTPAHFLDVSSQTFTAPIGGATTVVNVEYVDQDTSGQWGHGNTFSL